MRLIFLAISFLAYFAIASADSLGAFDENSSVADPLTARGPVNVEALDIAAREPLPVPEGVATPTRRHHTNAHRLRNGLPLLPPTKRRSGALRPRTSCLPLTNNVGTVNVTNVSTNTVIGFLTQSRGQYYVSPDPAKAISVSLPSLTPFGSTINIEDLSVAGNPYPLVGGVAQVTYDLASGSPAYASVYGVLQSPENSPPSNAGNIIKSGNPNSRSESQIWTINCVTLEITAQWTNTDGSHPMTQIFYDPTEIILGLTGDLAAYEANFRESDGTSYPIKLTFVPNS